MHWTTDAVTALPKTRRGHNAIQVYVDRCTKLKHFAATKDTDTASDLADATLRTIIGPHGMPKSMVSDRDPRITSHFWRALQSKLGSTVVLSTANQPETDGQSEREIQTLITALRGYADQFGDQWDDYLPAIELAFNSKVQASTGASPFFLVYGVDARLPIDCMLDEARQTGAATTVPAAADRLQRMKDALAAARSRTELAQARQKRAADQHRRLMELKVGDRVMLSTEGLTLRSGNHKLTAKYLGPFPIVAMVNSNAVTLEFPPLLRALHPTVNISRLKLYRDGAELFPGRPQQHTKPPAIDTDTNGNATYEVERIIAQRGPPRRRELLVRWLGYAPEDDQWKSRRELTASAPNAVAEFDALQGDAALAAISAMHGETGTPPAPRLVGIEPNPGPPKSEGQLAREALDASRAGRALAQANVKAKDAIQPCGQNRKVRADHTLIATLDIMICGARNCTCCKAGPTGTEDRCGCDQDCPRCGQRYLQLTMATRLNVNQETAAGFFKGFLARARDACLCCCANRRASYQQVVSPTQSSMV